MASNAGECCGLRTVFFLGFGLLRRFSLGRLLREWLTFSLAYSSPTSYHSLVFGSYKRNLDLFPAPSIQTRRNGPKNEDIFSLSLSLSLSFVAIARQHPSRTQCELTGHLQDHFVAVEPIQM